MTLFRLLLLLFITVPLLELYLLIQIGGSIGIMPTLAICVITAVAGAFLVRQQGLRTIVRIQTNLSRGELPATELMEGAMLLITGALLLTPGLFTDAVGFLCLVPQVRVKIATGILNRLFTGVAASASRTVTIDGECWDEENNQLDHMQTPTRGDE